MNPIVIFLWVCNWSLKTATWSFFFRSWQATKCFFTRFLVNIVDVHVLCASKAENVLCRGDISADKKYSFRWNYTRKNRIITNYILSLQMKIMNWIVCSFKNSTPWATRNKRFGKVCWHHFPIQNMPFEAVWLFLINITKKNPQVGVFEN